MSDLISRRDVVECVYKALRTPPLKGVFTDTMSLAIRMVNDLPSAQPERTGRWILDRSGRYCCNRCMEPCAGYVMMRPRDKYCKMCGSRNEVTE